MTPQRGLMANFITRLSRHTIVTLIVLIAFCFNLQAGDNQRVSDSLENDQISGIVNPYGSTCYDWRGTMVPCDFKRPYADLLLDTSSPATRFTDNRNGTVTDRLTGLIWLKDANCFGMKDWKGALQAVKSLKAGDCGPDPAFVLTDNSSVGDWRLPTMRELCTLIDFSRRSPALPADHLFGALPTGFHWSATVLESHSEVVWIVYFESGTTCYDEITSRAGHVWPVRGPAK